MTLGGGFGRGGRAGVALLRRLGIGCCCRVALCGGLRFGFRGGVTLGRGGPPLRARAKASALRAACCAAW